MPKNKLFDRTINQFIHSSLSIAFFTVTSFSTAYCYGWGQALFHGYPWWHVEVGQSGIARALAYVIGTSLLAILNYSLVYRLLSRCLNHFNIAHLSSLRAVLFMSVFTLPVFLVFYISLGHIPLYMTLAYLLFTGLFVWLFKRRIQKGQSEWHIRFLFNEANFWLFNLFIFLYFSLLALYIGYLRSEFRQTYDYISLNNEQYYILSTTSDKHYILGKQPENNRHFLIFNRETKHYYDIHVVDIQRQH